MDPFVGEIRVFGFDFPPKGWAFCDGQLLPITQNTALFSLLGTFYGGDGKSTFALPDLEGQAAIHQGQGTGLLSDRFLGEPGGAPFVTLLQTEIPLHTHQAKANSEPATQQAPAPNRSLARSAPGFAYQSNTTSNLVPLNPQAATAVGGGFPHNNMPPSLVLNFCIALQGVFPARS
jgi:microcystin-dependent protein